MEVQTGTYWIPTREMFNLNGLSEGTRKIPS